MDQNKESVEKVKQRFLADVEKNPTLYHEEDVNRVRNEIWSTERFVLGSKSEDEALEQMIKILKWRKSFGIHERTDDYFPEEIYQIQEFFEFGSDKEGRPLLWSMGKTHYKSAELGSINKEFMVHQVEKIDRQTSYKGWAMVFDLSSTGLSNIDIDFNYFLVEVIQNCYPNGVAYILVIDMPWILNAVAKMMLAFMKPELRESVKFIKREQFPSFMDIEKIPLHLGGKYDKQLTSIPDGLKTIHQCPHFNFTSKQIDKIYSTYKSILRK